MLKFSIYDIDLQKLLSMISTAITPDLKKKLICINIKKDECSIIAQNLDLSSVINFTPTSIESEGFVVINIIDLQNVVKQFNSELITISVLKKSEYSSLVLSSNSTSIELSTEMEFDSPFTFNKADSEHSLTINSKKLLNSIKKVFFCASDIQKPFLNSILFDFTDNKSVTLVSTDGKKLAVTTESINSNIQVNTSFLLPKKLIDHLVSILSYFDTDVQLNFSKDNVLISINNILIKGQLLEDKFPDYKSVIPNNNKFLDIKKNDIIYQLKKVLVIEKTSAILAAKFNIATNFLKIESSAGVNNIKIEIPCSFSESDNFMIMCHVKPLIEIINHIETESVRISFNQANSPILINPLSNEKLFYILAPIIF